MKQREFLWDNLKVIAMMMVVMTHAVCPYQSERCTEFYWIFIMTFTMPLFTMISGYWYKGKPMSIVLRRFGVPLVVFTFVNYTWGGVFFSALYTRNRFA